MLNRKRLAAAAAGLVLVLSILVSGCDLSSLVASSGEATLSNLSAQPAASQASEYTAPAVSGSSAEMPVEYYFPRAGQAPKPVLISIMQAAKKTLDVAIYSFTDTDIANALIAAKERGVTVRVISDRESSGGKYQKSLLQSLKTNGIPVKINTHVDLMHLKVTIADKAVVTTGSFNYTKTAEQYNDEVFVVLRSAKAGQDFDTEFSSMWNDSGNFTSF